MPRVQTTGTGEKTVDQFVKLSQAFNNSNNSNNYKPKTGTGEKPVDQFVKLSQDSNNSKPKTGTGAKAAAYVSATFMKPSKLEDLEGSNILENDIIFVKAHGNSVIHGKRFTIPENKRVITLNTLGDSPGMDRDLDNLFISIYTTPYDKKTPFFFNEINYGDIPAGESYLFKNEDSNNALSKRGEMVQKFLIFHYKDSNYNLTNRSPTNTKTMNNMVLSFAGCPGGACELILLRKKKEEKQHTAYPIKVPEDIKEELSVFIDRFNRGTFIIMACRTFGDEKTFPQSLQRRLSYLRAASAEAAVFGYTKKKRKRKKKTSKKMKKKTSKKMKKKTSKKMKK